MIHNKVGVMDDALAAGAKLHGADIFCVLYFDREYEIAENILARRSHFVWLAHVKNKIGLAELPSIDKMRRRRQAGSIAFRRAIFGPLIECANLCVAEPSLTGEIPVAGLGRPGRHVAAFGDGRDLRGSLPRVFIAEQREWSSFAGPMTRRAVLKQNGSDVFGERH